MALIVLSVMGLMAAIGLAFAWFTTESRREHDHPHEASTPGLPRVASVAPARLTALGYLPGNTDAVAGIHVAELMGEPGTQWILRRMRADSANFGIRRLEHLTGLKLEELDHVVLGLTIQEEVLPRGVVVVQTRRPYDAGAVRAALNVNRSVKRGNKTLDIFTPEQTQLSGVLWCAAERTLVFGLQPKDLDDVPNEPIPGVGRFPTRLQRCLTDRMSEGTQAWIAGYATQWAGVLGLLQLAGLAGADAQALAKVRGFCGALQGNGEVKAELEVACADPAGAGELDNYLAGKGLEADKLPQRAENWPRGKALLGDLAQSLVRERTGDRVLVQFKASTENIRQAFATPGAVGSRAAK